MRHLWRVYAHEFSKIFQWEKTQSEGAPIKKTCFTEVTAILDCVSLNLNFNSHLLTRAGHFSKKVGNSIGAVWISFTYASSSTKKKELNLYLIFRPRCQTREIFKGNALKIQRDIDIFSFSEFLLIISDQKWFLIQFY